MYIKIVYFTLPFGSCGLPSALASRLASTGGKNKLQGLPLIPEVSTHSAFCPHFRISQYLLHVHGSKF